MKQLKCKKIFYHQKFQLSRKLVISMQSFLKLFTYCKTLFCTLLLYPWQFALVSYTWLGFLHNCYTNLLHYKKLIGFIKMCSNEQCKKQFGLMKDLFIRLCEFFLCAFYCRKNLILPLLQTVNPFPIIICYSISACVPAKGNEFWYLLFQTEVQFLMVFSWLL